MNRHQKDLLRREGFVHGFVAARAAKTAHETLLVLEEADRAWIAHVDQRKKSAT
jgi:hypothetical protein